MGVDVIDVGEVGVSLKTDGQSKDLKQAHTQNWDKSSAFYTACEADHSFLSTEIQILFKQMAAYTDTFKVFYCIIKYFEQMYSLPSALI